MVAAPHKLKAMMFNYDEETRPILQYNNQKIEYVAYHRLLGIIYQQEDMTFSMQTDKVIKEMNKRTNVILKLNKADWGPTQETSKITYVSYCESLIRFGILAVYPYLSKALKNKTNIAMRKPIRAVFGFLKNTWNEAIYLESNLDDYEKLFYKEAINFFGKNISTDTPLD